MYKLAKNVLGYHFDIARLRCELDRITGLAQESFTANVGAALPTISRRERDGVKAPSLALEKIKRLLLSMGGKGRALHRKCFGEEH